METEKISELQNLRKKNPIARMRMKMGDGMKKELKKVGGRPMTGRLRVGK